MSGPGHRPYTPTRRFPSTSNPSHSEQNISTHPPGRANPQAPSGPLRFAHPSQTMPHPQSPSRLQLPRPTTPQPQQPLSDNGNFSRPNQQKRRRLPNESPDPNEKDENVGSQWESPEVLELELYNNVVASNPNGLLGKENVQEYSDSRTKRRRFKATLLKESSATIKDLHNKICELNQINKALYESNRGLNSDNENLSKGIAEKDTLIASLEKDRKSLMTKAKTEIQKLKEEREKLRKDQKQTGNQLKASQEQCDRLQGELRTIKSDNETLKAVKLQLEQQLDEELHNFNSTITTMKAGLSEKDQQLEAKEASCKSLQDELGAVVKGYEKLKNDSIVPEDIPKEVLMKHAELFIAALRTDNRITHETLMDTSTENNTAAGSSGNAQQNGHHSHSRSAGEVIPPSNIESSERRNENSHNILSGSTLHQIPHPAEVFIGGGGTSTPLTSRRAAEGPIPVTCGFCGKVFVGNAMMVGHICTREHSRIT